MGAHGKRRSVGMRSGFIARCIAPCLLALASAPAPAQDLAAVEVALAGHARYLHEAARAHEHGEGVPRDAARALALYCESARLGDVESMFALGWMYANGRGAARNDELAGTLFAMAAFRGHEHAQRMTRFTGEYSGAAPECLRTPASLLVAAVPAVLDARIGRLGPERRAIAELIRELAPRYQISPALALAVAITESALDPRAISPKNAMGVMQLIPDTAARFRVRDAFDPRQNIEGGLAYLRWLLAYFEGDVVLAVAAYNAGERAVERHRGVPPYRETQAYVERVLAVSPQRRHPYDPRIVEPSEALTQWRAAQQLVDGS